jgi:hypothetical protein
MRRGLRIYLVRGMYERDSSGILGEGRDVDRACQMKLYLSEGNSRLSFLKLVKLEFHNRIWALRSYTRDIAATSSSTI